MRAYHDPEGLASIGLPAEKKEQSRVGFKIASRFFTDFGSDEVEAMVRQVINENDLNSRQPDVVFHETDNPIAVVVIEIEDGCDFGNCKKVVHSHLKNNPTTQEGFAYNIDAKEWVRFYRGKNNILTEESSYSERLGIDFEDYLY